MKTRTFAAILGSLGILLTSGCSTPTISPSNDGENGLITDDVLDGKNAIITDDALVYFVLDTVKASMDLHFNGMCYFNGRTLTWQPNLDKSSHYYSYERSEDTLFFFSDETKYAPRTLQATYLRLTDNSKTEGSSLSGVWIKQQDEGDVFSPESLVVSGTVAIKAYSLKDDPIFTNSRALELMILDVVATQDSSVHPLDPDEERWEPDWHLTFATRKTEDLSEEKLSRFCDPCEDLVRTKNSVAFTRKGIRFELYFEDMVHNEKETSYNFRVVANGQSCTYSPVLRAATKNICEDPGQLESFFRIYKPEQAQTYTYLGDAEPTEFLKCYHKLF